MKVKAFSSGYMNGKVYVIWDIPYDEVNYFELWRNDIMLKQTEVGSKGIPVSATSIHTDLEKSNPFIHPCLFDHDHHTHLFWKDSNHQLMYVDEEVQKFQEYKYYIIGKRIDENGKILDEMKSNMVYVEVQ